MRPTPSARRTRPAATPVGAVLASGSRSRARLLLPLLLAAASALLSAGRVAGTRALAGPSLQEPWLALETVWEEGEILVDTNGDGFIDGLRARVLVAPPAADLEVAAAADIAARMGYETMALDLPLVTSTPEGSRLVAVGPAALAVAGAPPLAALDGQPEGTGLIEPIVAVGRGVLAVTGTDTAGTRAAAHLLAARLPSVWDPDGPTLTTVLDALRGRVDGDGESVVGARSSRLLVRSGEPGIARLDVELTVVPDRLDAVVTMLEEIAAAAPEGDSEPAATTAEARATAAAAAPPRDAAEAAGQDEPTPPEPAAQEGEVQADGEPSYEDLRFPGLATLRVVVRSATAAGVTRVEIVNESAAPEASGRRPGPGAKDGIDLAGLYGIEGMLGDGDGNLIPDRVDVILSPSGDTAAASVDLAARLALESTGLALPVALAPEEIDDPAGLPTLVLIGAAHPRVVELQENGRLELPELAPGEGWIGIVPEAFDDERALVVVGADEDGLERALEQLAERFPWIWARGKDRPVLADVEDDLWTVLSQRSPAGQAAAAVSMLEDLIDGLEGGLESAEIDLHVEKADPRLQGFVEGIAAGIDAAAVDVAVENLDVRDAELLLDEEFEIPSEVDAFWTRFRDELIPRVGPGDTVRLHAGISEPPEIRREIARRARDELVGAGADPAAVEVTVLSAYKQGYSFLHDQVRPALEGLPVDSLTIRFAEVGPPEDWPQQAMYTPTRWLLEIFPIDEVLARDLGLDLEQIAFEKTPVGSTPYEVVAHDAGGEVIHRASFSPRLVLRPYFDRFPDYEMARVTTGWLEAEVDGEPVVDARIVTDLERFWDRFQGEILPAIYEHVMLTAEGTPRRSDAPHFGELRVEVALSEPDYRIGVDQEQIASMEALHEEIYFGVLHFFDVLGRMATGSALDYPGRVIPIVRPRADGEPGFARVRFTGFRSPRPRVEVVTRSADGTRRRLRRDIHPTSLERPELLSATVRAGRPGIVRLTSHVAVDFERDRRDEFVRRRSADYVDRAITSAEQVTGLVEQLERLQRAGLYAETLAYPGFGELEVAAGWGWEIDPEVQRRAVLPFQGAPPPAPDVDALLPPDPPAPGEPLVQWRTPMPPAEAHAILALMADRHAEATAYRVGESYLGKEIWALDLMAPLGGTHWSQAKASALKPTVIYSARQHANEVSSTSHVLELAELILTDPDYEEVLDRVNVVIHPVTNPDGAQLAWELAQITPNHMLHAGYLGSLGVDATAGAGSDDPIYPEAEVRPKLWRTWLPDLFLNPHGYPSHEWVQIFSEYAAWVRSRATESRDWWGMRGWFMPSFNYVDDPDYPDHKAAAFEIRRRITEKINALEPIRELNRRAYDRYRRYTYAWDPENFKLDFTDDVLIYSSIKGSSGRTGPTSNPKVTIWSGTTEAPDETAFGDWLELVASAGLAWDQALLEYLLEGDHRIERTRDAFDGGVAFKVHRPRPATPPEPEESPPSGEGRR